MRRTISGLLSLLIGVSAILWGCQEQRTFSFERALFLSLLVAAGIIAALFGLWRLVPVRLLAAKPEPIDWDDVFTKKLK